jgi:TonB-dependent SusC/RagA subfamily outer membrane receptor
MSSLNGNNKPLFVIDGFIVGTDFNLSNLNVNDIESIEVLKDASSLAIYGTRGAAGVILISTKSGLSTQEGKVDVSINHYSSSQQVYNYPKWLVLVFGLNIGMKVLLIPIPIMVPMIHPWLAMQFMHLIGRVLFQLTGEDLLLETVE